jgi:hypothetical protein
MRPSLVLALAFLAVSPAGAQEKPKAQYIVGEVTSADAATKTVVFKTDTGTSISGVLAPSAVLVRAKPGSTNLTDATPVEFSEIQPGDRIMAHGFLASAGGTMDVRKLAVMTKGDIAQKQDAERADWKKRGLVAVVTSVDPSKNEITARTGRRPDAPTVVIDVGTKKATFRRYAPDSVKFSEAKPGTIADVHPGDELRALGDRGSDPTRYLAEQIVSGSFRVVAGAVTSVSPDQKQVVFKEDESQKPVTVTVGPDARMRHLPAEMAVRFGARQAAQQDGADASPPPGGAGQGGPRPAGPPGAPGGRRGFNPEDLIERMPTITIADLKAGDRILVSSTKGDDPSRMNAIVLVSGLEAIPAPAGPRRPGRGADVGLPADLMDLGLSLQ